MMIDLTPATTTLVQLLTSVADDQLDRPTPCGDITLGDLIDHIGAFAKGFVGVAHKEAPSTPPPPSAASLETGWRDRITRDLRACAEAWKQAEAWEGMTSAGGIELPGDVAGLVAVDELVVHGWDIAVSTGQPYETSPTDVAAAASFVTSFDVPRDGRLFGPVVPVPDSAPPLDRLLGLTGRDPAWQPPTT